MGWLQEDKGNQQTVKVGDWIDIKCSQNYRANKLKKRPIEEGQA